MPDIFLRRPLRNFRSLWVLKLLIICLLLKVCVEVMLFIVLMLLRLLADFTPFIDLKLKPEFWLSLCPIFFCDFFETSLPVRCLKSFFGATRCDYTKDSCFLILLFFPSFLVLITFFETKNASLDLLNFCFLRLLEVPFYPFSDGLN